MIQKRNSGKHGDVFFINFYVEDLEDLEALTKCAQAMGYKVSMWYDECLLAEMSGRGDVDEEVLG
jgi:hypothetical protein